MMFIPPNGGLLACGGYHRSSSNELIPVPEILCYDKSIKDWIYLSNIPNLKKLNLLSIDNIILIISNKMKSDDPNREDEFIPISKYDLLNRKWLMINQKETSNTQIKRNQNRFMTLLFFIFIFLYFFFLLFFLKENNKMYI